MPTPQVVIQPDAGAHLRLGFDLLADLLAPTLGPVGGLVANQQHTDSQPELLDDAATAVRRVMSLGDPRLDVGAMLMRNLVWRITQRVGDGGAMTAVLARAIFRDALRLTTAGVNPMIMAKGLRAGAEAVGLALAAQAQPVRTEDDLAAVALTVTNDRPLAQMLGEISYLLGADAHVITEKLVAPYLERRYLAGAGYTAQIASSSFFTDPARRTAVITDGMLALVDGPVNSTDEAVHLLTLAAQAEATSLTILATGFGDAALSVLVANHQAKERKVAVLGVKLKAVNEELRHALDDLSLLTGAEILGRPHTRPLLKAQTLVPVRRVESPGRPSFRPAPGPRRSPGPRPERRTAGRPGHPAPRCRRTPPAPAPPLRPHRRHGLAPDWGGQQAGDRAAQRQRRAGAEGALRGPAWGRGGRGRRGPAPLPPGPGPSFGPICPGQRRGQRRASPAPGLGRPPHPNFRERPSRRPRRLAGPGGRSRTPGHLRCPQRPGGGRLGRRHFRRGQGHGSRGPNRRQRGQPWPSPPTPSSITASPCKVWNRKN